MAMTMRFGMAAVLGAVLAAGAACSRAPTVGEQAMDAYQKGDYKTALPLLKKWAADPKTFVDNKPAPEIMKYVVDCEMKLGRIAPLPPPNSGVAANTPAAMGPVGTSAAPPPQQAGGGGKIAGSLPPIPGTGASTPLDQQALAAGIAQNGPDVPTGADRIPHPAPKAGEVLAMSIKEIANFEYDPVAGGDIPADVKQLDGATVRVKGFMIPLTQAEDIKEFALVPSLVSCCFGQPPGVQHVFTCRLPAGRTVQYTVDEIEVEGTLHVNVQRADGYTSSIFDVSVNSVRTVE